MERFTVTIYVERTSFTVNALGLDPVNVEQDLWKVFPQADCISVEHKD